MASPDRRDLPNKSAVSQLRSFVPTVSRYQPSPLRRAICRSDWGLQEPFGHLDNIMNANGGSQEFAQSVGMAFMFWNSRENDPHVGIFEAKHTDQRYPIELSRTEVRPCDKQLDPPVFQCVEGDHRIIESGDAMTCRFQ